MLEGSGEWYSAIMTLLFIFTCSLSLIFHVLVLWKGVLWKQWAHKWIITLLGCILLLEGIWNISKTTVHGLLAQVTPKLLISLPEFKMSITESITQCFKGGTLFSHPVSSSPLLDLITERSKGKSPLGPHPDERFLGLFFVVLLVSLISVINFI